jgi:hypothetical protein
MTTRLARGTSRGRSGRFRIAWRRALIAALLLPAVSSSGCSTRDPSNPFDPNNPDTQGSPALLRAFAEDGQVELRWSLEEVEDVLGVRVLRGLVAKPVREELNVLFEQVGAGEGRFVDRELANDSTYSYHLEVRTPAQEWIATEPDLATPGPSEPWVGDATGGGLVRITPDGRDPLFRVEASRDLLDLQIDPNGEVWGADYGSGQVVHFSREGEVRSAWEFSGCNTVAIDPLSAEIWIGSFDQQEVIRVDRSANVRFRFESAGLVEDISPGLFPEGGIWIASRFSGVTRLVRDQLAAQWPEFEWPVAITPDHAGWAWVIDRQRPGAAQILGDGRVVWSDAAMIDPKDGDLDGGGGFWIADPGRGGVIHVDGEGHEISFLAVGAVDAVTLDPHRQWLWLVFREQSLIRVVDLEGNELARAGVGGRPVKVEGYWRP